MSFEIVQRPPRSDGLAIVTREDGSALPPRLDLANHSPTGFEWGYGGSGPAQLALAILANCLEDDARAVDLHQNFKWYTIARLPEQLPWSFDENYVRKVAVELERRHERRLGRGGGMSEGQGHLELREEAGGLRHYLAGEPIHAGYGLELQLASGVWVVGRYEWNSQRESQPLLYLELGGPWEGNPDGGPEVVLRIPPQATLRWPRRDASGKPLP